MGEHTYHAALASLENLLCSLEAFGSSSQGILVDVHVSGRRKVFAVKGRFSEARKACKEN
jgi:hypothetical protein